MKSLQTIAAALLFVAGAALAQDATGRVIGTVSDPTGGVVPKAKVTVTNTATGVSKETTTNEDGYFQVLLLPIGTYTVSVENVGFRKTMTEPQKLEINQSLRVDVKLELGSTAEAVQVEANVTGVETVSATLAQSVTATTIAESPLNGRNALQLALLVPGVIPTNAGGAAPLSTGGFSIAGGRQDSVTFILDGGVNNNLLSNGVVLNPNPDTLEEFRILVNNYTAEYGRGGGGIISVVTKSGSNQFHGSAYDFVRNKSFNANSFFNNQAGLKRDDLKRNQYGFTIGGPIGIPKLFSLKDRLFFFAAYQGQKQVQAQTTSRTQIFTPAELTGDFSRSVSGGPDPLVVSYLQQYPYFQPNPTLAAQGIIDPTRIDAISKQYVSKGLIPASPTGSQIFQAGATSNSDEWTGKTDFMLTQNDRISVTLGWNQNPQLFPFQGGNAPGFPGTTTVSRYFGSAGYVKTLSPSLINDFRFTAQRNNGFQAAPAAKLPTASELGIKVTPDNPTGPPILGFLGGLFTAGFSPQGPTHLIDNTYTWSDTVTWVKGKHTLKGGFWYTPYQNNTLYDFYVNGEYYFYGSSGSYYSGNAKADFLMGLPDEFLQFPEAPSNIRTHNVGFFFQDEWKVRRNLTLTLGMRYEYSSPKLDSQGRSFSLKLGQQSQVFVNAPKGELFPGDPGAPLGSNFADRNDWDPRFGFAWDPKGNGKMSIRGGFGVFHDILKGEDNLQFNGQAPFFGFADLYFDPLSDNPTSAPKQMSDPYGTLGQPNPFPSKPAAHNINFGDAGFLPVGGGGVYFVDPNLRTPYVYQYNLNIQRELANGLMAEVAYVGSSSHKMTGLIDANPMVLGTRTRLFNTQPGVAAGSFSYLDEFANVGGGNYNAFTFGLTKRYGDVKYLGDLQAQLSYTYGKSIDNSSGFRSGASQVPYYNWNQFRAVSNWDITHYVAFSGAWELPFAKAWGGGPKRLTKGWNLYPIISYRTGLPMDIRAGLSQTGASVGPSGDGSPNLVRANLINSNVTYYDPRNQVKATTGAVGNYYFDPNAFERASLATLNTQSNNGAGAVTNAALRTYGTLGRNALRGPDKFNIDLSLTKKIALVGERAFLEIRGDFFNILNNVQWGNPNLTATSSLFGQISTTDPPRIIQLAARFTF